MNNRFLRVVAVLATLGGSAESAAAVLEVVVEGLQSADGTVMVRVYADEKGWLTGPGAVAQQEVSLEGWTSGVSVRAHFTLEPGEYAVSVYQDEDADGKLDANFIGIPKEPSGLSNKPKPRMGKPKFEDSVFTLTGEVQSITVALD